MKFSKLKQYISPKDKVSICIKESLQYNNFRSIRHVPSNYDEYYVYGFGIMDSEFMDEDFMDKEHPGSAFPTSAAFSEGRWGIKICIEIMLSEKPRKDF